MLPSYLRHLRMAPASSVVSFVGGVLPLIVAIMPDSDNVALPAPVWSDAVCKLSETQQAGLRAWHAMANTSCAYNISDPEFSVASGTMFVC